MNSVLRRLLFGDADIKEYATITVADKIKEKAYLEVNNQAIDVTEKQFLLCLEPVVFGIWMEQPLPPVYTTEYKMYFTPSAIKNAKRNTFAEVTLIPFDKIADENGTLFLFRQVKSSIRHINAIKTYLLYSKYYKKPGATFAQLKALAAAYSYPRRVRVISFKEGGYYNIFPMDLLGDISVHGKYVFGLRNTNTTLPRIMETKKLVVSEVSYQHKQTIYQLGAHHSAAPPAINALPFKITASKNFGFYLPEWADSYKEVSITKTINLGSHMLLWGDIKAEYTLKAPIGHLYHIHYLLYLYHKRKGGVYPSV